MIVFYLKGGINIYDAIIIGSGAGGATVSKNLSEMGHKVLILEKGEEHEDGEYVQHIKTKQISLESHGDYSNDELIKYFLEKGLEISYVEAIGGTTPVSIGNACFSCSGCYSNSITSQFNDNGLNILKELMEVGDELEVSYFPAKYWGPATKKIYDAGIKLGYNMEPMPKFIDFEKCSNCGLCVNGCVMHAKWDGTYFINKSQENNAELISNFTVKKILHENGEVKGVLGIDKEGNEKIFTAKNIVLSAGAINTPIILKNSGIENVGEELFFDIFTTIGGYLENSNLKNELLMGIKGEFGPYFISPHYSNQLLPLVKERGIDAKDTDIIGLMLKFADAREGKINKDGSIDKTLTEKDIRLIKKGYDKAVKILKEMGVQEDSIVATQLKGAHPGGTAALGKIVDNNFETEIKGLYVSDASVIPEAPGRPPILTIVALSKKVSKIIDEKLNN